MTGQYCDCVSSKQALLCIVPIDKVWLVDMREIVLVVIPQCGSP